MHFNVYLLSISMHIHGITTQEWIQAHVAQTMNL